MEYEKIKEINVQFDELFKLKDITLDDPNYIVYNAKAFFNPIDCNNDIKEFIDNVFQDLPIKYSYFETIKQLYVEDIQFKIIIKKKSISFVIKDYYQVKNIYTIQYASTLSNQKALISFLNEVHNIKIEQYNEDLIKDKINNHEDFDYKWMMVDSDFNSNLYVVRYKPLKINIKCKINEGCCEYISYLKNEGETYNDGEEELSISKILSKINYYQALLDHEQIIREKIASL